jgi:hypothetical protein
MELLLQDLKTRASGYGTKVNNKKKLKMHMTISLDNLAKFQELVLLLAQMMRQSSSGQLMEIFYKLSEDIWDLFLQLLHS